MGKEVEFKKQKVSSFLRFDKDITVGLNGDDYVKNMLTARLEGYVYQNTIAEKEITYHFDKPTFLDWLLGRRKSKTIKINISDALNNPPETNNTSRLYYLEKLD